MLKQADFEQSDNRSAIAMSKQIPIVDPEGLLEYSVVFNDRSLNHMSKGIPGSYE